MPRRRRDEDEGIDELEEENRDRGRKSRRSEYIDDVAEEDDEENEEEDYGGKRKSNRRKSRSALQFIDNEAAVDEDEDEDEEDEEESEDGFINDSHAELQDEGDGRRMRPHLLLSREEEQEDDFEKLEREMVERYVRTDYENFDDETTDVEQQALLPSIKDPKLWRVQCVTGHVEAVACLMQKSVDKGSQLQIRSAIAIDHIKSYIYVEADKEAHVKEACKVESKAIDLSSDTWVRMKTGTYKGDIARVVDVDNLQQRVTVKLIPRIDLHDLANKLDGREVVKKKFVPAQCFMNLDEARKMHIPVKPTRDPSTGDYFQNIGGMLFKDGFLLKTVAMKSISLQNIQPTFVELEKFWKPEDGDDDIANFSTLFITRKKGHFMEGDAVMVVEGDLKDLMGWVEKVEEETVHMRPKREDLPGTILFNEKSLCKYFKLGDHVKVVSGSHEGVTGMAVKVEGCVLIIVSDTTKEDLHVFADNVVGSSEINTGVTRIGDYDLHDLVLLDRGDFGLIIGVENEAFQVLKGVPDRSEVTLVRLREIIKKVDRRINTQDQAKNVVSVKDVVKIVKGPCRGKQGLVEHIFRKMLFINDQHHLKHAGYVCTEAQSCIVLGGSPGYANRNGDSLASRSATLRAASQIPPSPRGPPSGVSRDFGGRLRGGRRHDSLVGSTIKIIQGSYKGCRGRVCDVKGQSVRVELDAQMKIVTVGRNLISDNVAVSTTYRQTPRHGLGSETPMHPSRTPLHPNMTPMRDPGAAPIHDGMRTPMRDRAWNPYAPMSPARNNHEHGNAGSWGIGTVWANTPGASAPIPSSPMAPSSTSYLPGTHGGQPMTPDTGGLGIMSPIIGGEDTGPWFLPDIVVNVLRSEQDPVLGVVREVLLDGSCKVSLQSTGETVPVLPCEMDILVPKKYDKIKILSGGERGAT